MSLNIPRELMSLQIAKCLLRSILRREIRHAVIGDFEEVYAEIAQSRGRARANLWYWWQILRSFPGFIAYAYYWSGAMFKMNLVVSWRNLWGQKLPSLINIFGLAIAIACSILIFTFVRHELSYDSFHENADFIYRVLTEKRAPNGDKAVVSLTPMPLAPTLLSQHPEIRGAIRFMEYRKPVRYGGKIFTENLLFTDADVFEMFTFPLIKGDPKTALHGRSSIVISERAAKKYFGEEEPMGQRLTIIQDRAEDFLVMGVAQNVPDNSSIAFDFILPIERGEDYQRQIANWGSSTVYTYVLVPEGVPIGRLEKPFPSFVEKYYGARISEGRKSGSLSAGEDAWRIQLQPIRDVHLNPEVKWGLRPVSNPVYSYLLSSMAVLVLTIACINFMTLALGRSAIRAKEVGMRKVMGANRAQLFRQFLVETVLLTCAGLLLGLLLAQTFLPTFNDLAGKELRIVYLSDPTSVVIMILTAGVLGATAGSFPALIWSRFQPVEALKRKLRLGGRNRFGKSLVTTQFTISAFLIIAVLLMSEQLSFLRTKNLGYKPEQVVVLPSATSGSQGALLVEAYKNELDKHPEILHVTSMNNPFTRGFMNTNVKVGATSAKVWFYMVNHDFLSTLDMELLEGRDFSRDLVTDQSASVIVNEALVQAFGWESALGKQIDFGPGLKVIGVIENFHFRSLHHEIEPAILALSSSRSSSNIVVKIRSQDVEVGLAILRETWRRIAPDKPFEFYFLDQDVHSQYRSEERWMRIIKYSAILAMLTSCMGLFGLMAIIAPQRVKEIGVRKVLGASIPGIVALLSRELITLVALANMLAWPIAFIVLSDWLENFAYRFEMSIWTFVFAGALTSFIALSTVSLQAIKAALSNPVAALRHD